MASDHTIGKCRACLNEGRTLVDYDMCVICLPADEALAATLDALIGESEAISAGVAS